MGLCRPGAELGAELGYCVASVSADTPFPRAVKASYTVTTQTISIVRTYADVTVNTLIVDRNAFQMNGSWIGGSYDANSPCNINSEVLKPNQGNV